MNTGRLIPLCPSNGNPPPRILVNMKRSREHPNMGLSRLFQPVSDGPTLSHDTPSPSTLNGPSLASVHRVERSQILATSSKHTSTDCVSSTALMVYRGIGAGIAWTIGVDLYALVGASDRAWQAHLDSLSHPSTKSKEFVRLLFKSGGRNVLLFGGFLTVFGGLTCSMETVRGRHDLLNPFVGGFASGLVIMPKEMYKTPKVIIGGATLCGAAAMALYQFIPASSQGREQAPEERRVRI